MMQVVCSHCFGPMGAFENTYLANVMPTPVGCCSPECAVAYQRKHARESVQLMQAETFAAGFQSGGEIKDLSCFRPTLVSSPPKDNRAQEIRDLQESLRLKNRALDALHYVWCTGNCETGIHRFGDHPALTEDLVLEAETQVMRMRTRLENEKGSENT